MLGMKLVRDNPKMIADMLEKRNMTFALDRLLSLDEKRRALITGVQKLKQKKNTVSQEIARAKKDPTSRGSAGRSSRDIVEKMGKMKKLADAISKSDVEIKAVEIRVRDLMMRLPNVPHESVPVAKDETGNLKIRDWGKPRKFDFTPKDHIDLGQRLGIIDVERAAKVAGSRFYFLKGDLVLMNYALIKFALDFLDEKGFEIVQPPYMLNREAMEGGVILSDFKDIIYKVEGEELYLIGTSEHAILAMHMNETFDARDLPARYAGVSPCFRKEAGAHGRDTKGIFRVHQFEKVEQFVFAPPDSSWDELEKMIGYSEEAIQRLEVPYRVMLLSTGDMGKVAAKTYDLEAWLPGQGKFRELVSCSNCTDFQSTTLAIKYREKPHEDAKQVHTLNSTLIATERTMIALMENHQREDGSIRVPEALRRYMNGVKEITPA